MQKLWPLQVHPPCGLAARPMGWPAWWAGRPASGLADRPPLGPLGGQMAAQKDGLVVNPTLGVAGNLPLLLGYI